MVPFKEKVLKYGTPKPSECLEWIFAGIGKPNSADYEL